MTPQRTQNKENEKGKDVLRSLINSFFVKCMKIKPAHGIQQVYKEHESTWFYYVHKKRKDPKTKSHIMMDAFESSILKSHKAILKSDRSIETKLSMLRVLRHVQGKGKIACFVRELPLWVKIVFLRYKQFKQKKHEDMINPSLNLKVRSN